MIYLALKKSKGIGMGLIDAVIKNDTRMVKELLANGADVHETDDWANVTPLHHAARRNSSIEIIKLLLDAGANINAIDNLEWMTPLNIARLHKRYDIIDYLNLRALFNLSCLFFCLGYEKEPNGVWLNTIWLLVRFI